jgi:PhnB protein
VQHLSRAPNGAIAHVTVHIGDCVVMMAQARDPWPAQEISLYVYLRDVDAAYKRALDAGATSIMAVADQFYGDRHGGVKSSNGIWWWMATHIEDISPEELDRRSKEAFAKQTHG